MPWCFLSPDASSHASSPSLVNNTVGNQKCSSTSNVGNQKCSSISNVVRNQMCSSKPNVVGSQKSSTNSTVVGQISPNLTYSGVVGQIPNSNSPNSNSPNSNLPNSSPPNSAQSSVQNSGSIPDVQITGSNSVDSVDSEMASAGDSLVETAELSPEELKTLRKLLSPANVKRIGLGHLPGDHALKSKGRKHK